MSAVALESLAYSLGDIDQWEVARFKHFMSVSQRRWTLSLSIVLYPLIEFQPMFVQRVGKYVAHGESTVRKMKSSTQRDQIFGYRYLGSNTEKLSHKLCTKFRRSSPHLQCAKLEENARKLELFFQLNYSRHPCNATRKRFDFRIPPSKSRTSPLGGTSAFSKMPSSDGCQETYLE